MHVMNGQACLSVPVLPSGLRDAPVALPGQRSADLAGLTAGRSRVTGGSAWDVLQALPAWLITSVPRRPQPAAAGSAEDGDVLAAQRLAALASAFHAGSPVAFGWAREAAGGPV